jgi:hypothetical protein
MQVGKTINSGTVANQKFKNWLTISNAYATAHSADGLRPMNEKDARVIYDSMTKGLLSVANTRAGDHNKQVSDLRKIMGGDRSAVDMVMGLANGLQAKMAGIARNAIKAGVSVENAEATALNAYYGNPGYDQFAGLQQLAEQLYEQLTFVQSFIEEGDAVQLSPEIASGAKAISRFRIPRIQASGAAKIRNGDLNPYLDSRLYGNNSAQIDILNEFKNAVTEEQTFFIDNEQQQMLFNYTRSIAPALAGFILQNQLFDAMDVQVMQAIERMFVDGWGKATYDGESGSYGILTPSIMLALGSAGAASPLLANGADWAANPNTLIQQITNYNYLPAVGTLTQPLPASADPMQIYKDIVRLLNLVALTNVNTSGKVVLYMPTSIYSIMVQYLSTGTFNRTLGEALKLAVNGDVIKEIVVKTSGLLNARTNSLGTAQYNHVVAVVHGAPVGKKAILSPMATATPMVQTGLVSEMRSNFAASLTFGGPMVIQRGQVFDLSFSAHA